MLTFLGYTLAVVLTIAIVPAGIAVGIFSFKKGIPSVLNFAKNKINSKKRDSLDIEIENKRADIQWLKEKKEKISLLSSLDKEEILLREDIDREAIRLKESLLEDGVSDKYINDKDW